MDQESVQKNDLQAIQINCVVCNSNSYKPLFYISPRRIVECSNCGHEYVNPLPHPKSVPECKFIPGEEESVGTQIDLAYIKKIFDRYGVKGGKLLDLGCGQGRLERKLIESGWAQQDIYLMDTSERNIEVVKNKYPLSNFIHGDAQKGIGINNYFDCVLMVEFLEHLANPATALKNASNALKQGGLFIMRGLPNNQSLEAFIGLEKWRMRQFEQHNHFFNTGTFSTFAQNLSGVNILEFGTFLQEGYRSYDIERIARNIGVINESNDNQYIAYDGKIVQSSELAESVLAKIKNVNFSEYKNRTKLTAQQIKSLLSGENIEEFFDTAALDPFLSPDFSVVMRKDGR